MGSMHHLANIKNTDEFVYINQFGGNPHVPALTKSSLYFGKKNTEIKYTAAEALSNMKTGIDYQINIRPSPITITAFFIHRNFPIPFTKLRAIRRIFIPSW